MITLSYIQLAEIIVWVQVGLYAGGMATYLLFKYLDNKGQSMPKMRAWNFTLKLETAYLEFGYTNFEDRLYRAGCSDATITREGKDILVLDFSRESRLMSDAISSACEDIQKALPGTQVTWVAPGPGDNL